jgi:Dyp-type peroxidase family
MVTQKHNDAHPDNPICSLVGVNFNIWRRWDAKPATELRDFDAKIQTSSKTGKPVFPKWEGGHIFVLCKSNSIDSVIDLVRSYIEMYGKNQFNEDNVKSYTQTIGFAYNGGKDLTGFIDGTRNPDHMLRALTDQVLIHPGDCPNDKADTHVGGCYAYAGKFVHDLKKFRAMSDEEKNNLMGRDLRVVTPHKGFDNRPENPRLENAPEYAHTNRGHGSMYRQAYPFRNENEEGLFFCAFSRFLSEIDSALNRMAGHVESGEVDGVFKFSKNVHSNYYYVPSVPELQELFLRADVVVPENERAAPGKLNLERNNSMENKKKINIEYCTNCGYVTHYMAIKQAIEEVSPNVVVVPNPFLPRLSAFEITTEEGEVLWSKLSHPDGRTNYAHVFPDKKIVCERVRNYLGLPSLEQPLAPEK